MKKVFGLIIMLLIVGCTPKPLITEEQRRSHLLMPNKESEPFKAWVAEYGDTADSWLLFTIDFHTKYIGQLDKRIQALSAALEAYPDPNEIKKHWSDQDFTVTSEDVMSVLDPNAIRRIIFDSPISWESSIAEDGKSATLTIWNPENDFYLDSTLIITDGFGNIIEPNGTTTRTN